MVTGVVVAQRQQPPFSSQFLNVTGLELTIVIKC